MRSRTSTHQGTPAEDGSAPPHLNSELPENHDDRHPADTPVPDPTNTPPWWDENQFASILEQLVADDAPRLFAVIQEYGTRLDAWIAAWGMAFDDHAEVISVEGSTRMSLQTPATALLGFHEADEHIHARLVWFNPEAITADEDSDDAITNDNV